MTQFRASGLRDGQNYTGVFEAASADEASHKLKDQGYQILLIEEVRPAWPMGAVVLLVVLVGLALFCGAVVFFQRGPSVSTGVVSSKPSPRVKTPVDVLGTWVNLKSGPYLISMSATTCAQAIQYKKSGDKKHLNELIEKNDADWTRKYGAGRKVFVNVWHDAEHIVEIKFQDTGTLAWVEDTAVL